MNENDKFLNKKENSSFQKFEVDNSYTNQRKNVTFSTNYLDNKDQILLLLKKNFISLIRNKKSLVAIFISPIIFLYILIMIQHLSDTYSQGKIIKEQLIDQIDNISLKRPS